MTFEPIRELRELFARERMLGFCDVRLPLPGSPSGILRINRPGDSNRSGHYLALLFLIDAESDETRLAVERWLASVKWAEWPEKLHSIDMVIDMPNAESPAGLVQKQVDVYLRPEVEIGRPETIAAIHRTLPGISRMEVGEMVAWDEAEAAPAGGTKDARAGGLLGRLAGLLGRGKG
ncbi:hypothetical protein KGQ64_05760 [bacterium]|nr:hypothetical protein [bacterium]